MATTKIGSSGVTFPDATVQDSAGSTSINKIVVGTSSGTWTKPATVKSIKVTVVGGGAGGLSSPNTSGYYMNSGGGGGGTSICYYPAASLPGPQPYTVGAGGSTGAGGTSSFGNPSVTVISATGGAIGSQIELDTAAEKIALGGLGGAGSGGNLNIGGLAGSEAYTSTSRTGFNYAGGGGSSAFGSGGITRRIPDFPHQSSGTQGVGYGGASSGMGRYLNSGVVSQTPGSPGVVIVEEFY
jgi:hypothetical protein